MLRHSDTGHGAYASACLFSLLWAALGACSGGASNASGSAGSSGEIATAGSGAGGVTFGGAGSQAGSSGSSSAGANSAGAPNGSAGTGGGSTGGGSGATSSSAGSSGATGGTSGSLDASGGTSGSSGAGGSRPARVLVYAIATAFDHASIPAAAMAIAQAATNAGLAVDVVPPGITTSNNKAPVPGDFTPQALAAYGAVVLLSTSGEPLGSPGTTEIKALVDFVTGGGGLVVINNASHAYDSSTANPSASYLSLIGADFNGQTAYGPGTCAPVGTHPSVKTLPATFDIVDEVYNFKNVNADIQVVLQCKDTPTATPRPVSWTRAQGSGRVFYTALGKEDHSWQAPELLVPNHVLPGLLWTMERQ
jgi:type 1 glutamine amidotransferase